ncbi:MAG: hypothetical protein IPJ30_16545 [Acidobacteria bacterium]|nr:hypothetical protein [Acidobacteriota bacterium]
MRGVDRIAPETGSVRHFSVDDGLASDFVVDSLCDRDGDLWFATTNGVSRLTPSENRNLGRTAGLDRALNVAGVPQAVGEPEAGQSINSNLHTPRITSDRVFRA